MPATRVETDVIIALTILSILNGIFVFYLGRRYIAYQSKPFIHPRQPGAVLLQCFAAFFADLFIVPFYLIGLLLNENVQTAGRFIFHATVWIPFVVFMYRGWTTFYNYQSEKDMVKSRVTGTQGWYATHACGNRIFTWVFLLVLAATIFMIEMFSAYTYKSPESSAFRISVIFIIGIQAILVFALVMAITFGISKLDDMLMIRKEFQLLLFMHLLITMINVLAFIQKLETQFLISVWWSVKITFGDSILIYVQTEYILKCHTAFEKEREAHLHHGHVQVCDLCSTLEGYLQFVEYLTKEYASENLFFVSEVFHFVRAFSPYVQGDEISTEVNKLWILPKDMPISDIMKLRNNWKERVIEIYKLYISYDGDRCINIPYQMREDIIALLKQHYLPPIQRLSSVKNLLQRIPSALNAQLSEKSLSDPDAYQLVEFTDMEKELSRASRVSTDGIGSELARAANAAKAVFLSFVDEVEIIPGVVEPEDEELLRETLKALISAAAELQYLMRGSFVSFTKTEEYARYALSIRKSSGHSS